MIQYNDSSEKTKIALLQTFKTLELSKILRTAGIRKAQGFSVFEVFKVLLLLVFQGKNLYRYLDSNRSDKAASKNTYYRFLNESTYNWRRFLLLLASKVISLLNKLTRPDRVNVLILDDSIIPRNRSKKVELLAKVHNHADNTYPYGFTMLTLGWSDGYSFIPTDFAMLSSRNKSNRVQEISANIDKRTNGYKRRTEALQKKTDVAKVLIQNTLNQGITADYVLMDTWFTHEPMIQSVLDEGLDVIGMVKQLKQRYAYQGKWYSLKELRTLVPKNSRGNILGSVSVKTKKGIPVKLVFVKNRNNKREWLAILSTDLTLSSEEIIRIYGNRWSIEVFFKSAKSFMKLGKEFQGLSYDMAISHTTIVYCRYILLEWLRREEKDQKTFGELFFMFCDDIRDMDLVTALQSLMSLFMEQLNSVVSENIETVKCQLQQWVDQQATYIKALFTDLSWES